MWTHRLTTVLTVLKPCSASIDNIVNVQDGAPSTQTVSAQASRHTSAAKIQRVHIGCPHHGYTGVVLARPELPSLRILGLALAARSWFFVTSLVYGEVLWPACTALITAGSMDRVGSGELRGILAAWMSDRFFWLETPGLLTLQIEFTHFSCLHVYIVCLISYKESVYYVS